MKRLFRTEKLAQTAAIALLALYGISGTAGPVAVLPTVTVAGKCSGCADMSSYYSSGAWSDRNVYLSTTMDADGGGEGMLYIPMWPLPEPKTEEQRQREREQCNSERTWKMSVFQTGISGKVQACAARYAAQNIFTVIELVRVVFNASCTQEIARETDAAARQFDFEHAACMAKANG